MRVINKKILFISLLFIVMSSLSSCGGSGSDNDESSNTLSGTAATGAAIDGVVNIYGNNGGVVSNVAIDALGKYSADVSGLTPPYCICVIPSDASKEAQYSYASGPGVANVTPLTTLTLYIATGNNDPADLIDTWPSVSQDVVASAADAQAVINANFASLFSAQGLSSDFDYLTSPFVPGDQFDQVLDQLNIDISGAFPVITVDGSPFDFDPEISIDDASGTVTFTGAGADLLNAQGKVFQPTGVIGSLNFGLTFFEGNGNDDTGDFLSVVVDSSTNEIVLISVATEQGVYLWLALDGNIAGAVFNGTTVTFTNTSLSGTFNVNGVSNNTVLVLNGSLALVQ